MPNSSQKNPATKGSPLRSAVIQSVFWIFLALVFAGWVHQYYTPDRAKIFLTAYLIEQSLSFDNLFAFILVFQSLKVPPRLQYRVLTWGIVSAIAFRGVCIFGGIEILQKFQWINYVFGAILLYTGITTFKAEQEAKSLEGGRLYRFMSHYLPMTPAFHGSKFLVRINKKWVLTPLAMALILVEISDVIFAVDSVPAVLSISQDGFIIYSSNIFAILGLRSFYFILLALAELFRFIKYGVGVILIFVAVKILLHGYYNFSISFTLFFVFSCLILSILCSALIKKKVKTKELT